MTIEERLARAVKTGADASELLQELVNQAYENGDTAVNIPSGVYCIGLIPTNEKSTGAD